MIETPPGASQRQHLTIAFSDLSNSTGIAAALEPENYADLLHQLREIFEQIVPRHGGEIARIDGDGFLYIFGYPNSFEDSGRRAAEAAIDLHSAVRSLDQAFAAPGSPIHIHTGIHSGVVLLSQGDLVRGRYEMLGDATNVAARLCDFAGADEIIVSEATLGPDLPFFSTGPRQFVPLSGHSLSLPVFAVAGREPVANRFAARVQRGIAPFAGRNEELSRLQAGLERCRAGQGSVAVIVGPAGIGKTRLVGEFLDRAEAHGVAVHRGYCEAYLGARPFQPVAQIVRSMQAQAEVDQSREGLKIEALLSLFSARVSDQSAASSQLERVIPTLLDFLKEGSAAGPIILYVDDWQWADDASREVIETIARAPECPVFILLSSRQREDVLDVHAIVDQLLLPPLAANEADTAIEGLLTSAAPFLIEQIREQSGGSPLFLEELCHASRSGGKSSFGGERTAWLDMLIQTRFARLPKNQADLIKAGAVIGHIIPDWLFEAVTGRNVNHPDVHELGQDDFIYPGDLSGTLRFKHGITRDAIYNMVGLKERKILHAKVIAALDARVTDEGADDYLEALAYHHGAAGNAERAVHFAILAGDKAMAASALDRAQAQYRAALETLVATAKVSERANITNEIIHKFGMSSVVDPSPEQVPFLNAALQFAATSENVEGQTLANYWLGAIRYGLGDAFQAIEDLSNAIELCSRLTRPRLAVQLKANLGQAYQQAGKYADAAVQLDEAIGLMERDVNKTLPTGLAYALGCRGRLFGDQGDFETAEGYFDRIEKLLDGATPAVLGSIATKRSVVQLWQGNYATAGAIAAGGQAHGERTRSRFNTMMSRALLAYATWCMQKSDAAKDDLFLTTSWFASGVSQHGSSLCYAWMAEVLVETNDSVGTRRFSKLAFQRARAGDRLGEAMAARAMARMAAKGHGKRSPDHYLKMAFRSAEARSSRHEMAKTQLCEAELALAMGDQARAKPLLETARLAFADMQMESWLVQLDALAASNKL